MMFIINIVSTKRGNASEAKPHGGESSKPTPRSYPAERHGGQPPGAGAGSQNTRRKLERGSRGREWFELRIKAVRQAPSGGRQARKDAEKGGPEQAKGNRRRSRRTHRIVSISYPDGATLRLGVEGENNLTTRRHYVPLHADKQGNRSRVLFSPGRERRGDLEDPEDVPLASRSVDH